MDREFSIVEGGLSFPLTKWRRVSQTFEAPRVDSIPDAVTREMRKLDGRVRPGMSVAVGVGSRGVARLAEIVRATVSELKRLGARPFIVPAMGSHGGATPEGQLEVLAGYADGIDTFFQSTRYQPFLVTDDRLVAASRLEPNERFRDYFLTIDPDRVPQL